jgi:hypothetical protein
MRKIINSLKYNQENIRLLTKHTKDIEGPKKIQLGKLFILNFTYILILIFIDNATRWSSTYYMLNNFLNLKEPIEIVIATSKAKVFKDKESIRLKEEDYLLLETYK